MIWIDSTLLWYASYRVCRNVCGWALYWEKMVLALVFSLALKSLFLFFLISLGIAPTAIIQIGMSILALFPTLFLRESKEAKIEFEQKKRLNLITFFLIGVLFSFSMINAWFFPIIESDAVWYHIKSMTFLNEVRFDSDWVVPQLKQYPPFIPLLFSYLSIFELKFLKIIFPLLYLCLNIIFYSRVLTLTKNKKTACLFTMVLARTPYFWWHGVLPFLDLTAAVFYSTGIFYWYFWIQPKVENYSFEGNNSYGLVSGFLLGLSVWTRIEFLLYDLIPIFLTILIFIRFHGGTENLKSLGLFFASLLFFPSIWFLNLLTFEMNIWSQIKVLGAICAILWALTIGIAWGKWKTSEPIFLFIFGVSVLGYFVLLVMAGIGPVSTWKKIMISLYRTSTIPIFYLFTSSLVIFLFFENLKELSKLKRFLGYFLILFLFVHWGIFAFGNPKWPNLSQFFYATFLNPGDSVNLSDTRGMMSFYPVFLFFISSLPFIGERLIDD